MKPYFHGHFALSMALSYITTIILYIFGFPCVICKGQAIDLSAYKGANGPVTSISGQCACHGAFSCQSVQFIHSSGSNVECRGTYSCSNTTIVSNTNSHPHNVNCLGSNSCAFSDISATDGNRNVVDCQGYGACVGAYIHSVEIIWAKGSYSLFNAVIDSENSSNEVLILLWGDYAGYGATITCKTGNICNIYCHGYTSCYMLFIDCIDCTLNIYPDSVHTIAPITNIIQFETLLIQNAFHFEDIALRNDEDCNTLSINTTFDSYRERYNVSHILITTDNTGPICCRGEESCTYIDHIGYESPAKGNIICSAYWGCAHSNIISNNGSVFCEAYVSCRLSKISNASAVYCTGMWSCDGANIANSHHIVCAGGYGCANSDIISAGSDLSVYFTGADSGRETGVYCNGTDFCDIICAGEDSCSETTLICDGFCTVYCNEESQCPLGWTASPTSHPTVLTPNPTQYPSQSPSDISIAPTQYELLETSSATTTVHSSVAPTKVTKHTSFLSTDASRWTTTESGTVILTEDIMEKEGKVQDIHQTDENENSEESPNGENEWFKFILFLIGSCVCVISAFSGGVFIWIKSKPSDTVDNKPEIEERVDHDKKGLQTAIAVELHKVWNMDHVEKNNANQVRTVEGEQDANVPGDSDSDSDVYLIAPLQQTTSRQ